MDRRHEHVRLLAIFHFIYAGLIVAGSLVPIVWLLFASIWWPELANEVERESGDLPVMASGALAMGFASFGVLLAWIWAGVLVFAGRSLWAQSLWAVVLTVSGSYEQIYTYVIFGGLLFHIGTAGAVIVLRRRSPDTERPYKVWGCPWVPLLFILASSLLLVNTLVENRWSR